MSLAGCSGTPDGAEDGESSEDEEQAGESSGGSDGESSGQESIDCSDAINVIDAEEDFPEGGTYEEDNLPEEASLRVLFENTVEATVNYRIQADFIKFSSGSPVDAGTTSGSLNAGESEAYEFVYMGSPQTVVEIDGYELNTESGC
jgi:hypothetical protein